MFSMAQLDGCDLTYPIITLQKVINPVKLMDWEAATIYVGALY